MEKTQLREVTAPSVNEVDAPAEGSTVSAEVAWRNRENPGKWTPMPKRQERAPAEPKGKQVRCENCDHQGGQLVAVGEGNEKIYRCAGGCAHQRNKAAQKAIRALRALAQE